MSVQIHQKYDYSNIKNFSNQGDYNFYGIIYDATFPIQEDHNTFTCSLKIIDPEVNLLANTEDFNEQVVNVVIKSSSIDALPFIHRIGDIIRIHRGVYKPKQKKNVYVNVGNLLKYRSAWIMFSGESDPDSKDHSPIACSSETYTFESIDVDYIKACRQWIRTYLRQFNSLNFPKEVKLIERVYGSDCDVLVKIIEKKDLADKIVYHIIDETDGCELHAYKYFSSFEVNDLVRVRSVKLFESNRSVFIMNKFSNILKVAPNTDLYMEFMNSLVKRINHMDKSANLPLFSREENLSDLKATGENKLNIKKNIIIEPVINEEENYPEKSVEEITKDDTKVILTLNILDILPRNINDYVSVICPITYESRLASSFNDNEIQDGKYLWRSTSNEDTECKLYYNLMLMGSEHPLSNKNIKLYLSSYDGEGQSFMKHIPCDFSRKPTSYNQMKEFVENFQNHENYVKVIVEINNSGLAESDNVFRIVGNYKHN